MSTTRIYALTDADGAIRYIGKANSPVERLRGHLSCDDGTWRARWLRKLLRLGGTPGLLIIEECDESVWEERERYWIAECKRRGFKLTNATDGGEGVKFTVEVRAKIASKTKAFQTGRAHTPEHNAKVKAWMVSNHPLRGKTHNGGAKISQALRGRKLKPGHIESLRKKEFTQAHRDNLSTAMRGNGNGRR